MEQYKSYGDFRVRVLEPLLYGLRAWQYAIHCLIRPRIRILSAALIASPPKGWTAATITKKLRRPRRLAERVGLRVFEDFTLAYDLLNDADATTQGASLANLVDSYLDFDRLRTCIPEKFSNEFKVTQCPPGKRGFREMASLDSLIPHLIRSFHCWKLFIEATHLVENAALAIRARLRGRVKQPVLPIEEARGIAFSYLFNPEFFVRVLCAEATQNWLCGKVTIDLEDSDALDALRARLFGSGGNRRKYLRPEEDWRYGSLLCCRVVERHLSNEKAISKSILDEEQIGAGQRRPLTTTQSKGAKTRSKELEEFGKQLIEEGEPHAAIIHQYVGQVMSGTSPGDAMAAVVEKSGLDAARIEKIIDAYRCKRERLPAEDRGGKEGVV